MKQGAIILCGGKSSRMGADKCLLPFDQEMMLERMTRIISSVVNPQKIVVVAAANQRLPSVQVTIVRDEVEHQGPLAAIACGFAPLLPATDAAFVTGCDTPLLVPAVIEFLFGELGDFEAVVPRDEKRSHPLCAVYRTSVLETINQQLSRGHGSIHQLLDQLRTKRIPIEKFRSIDPDLNSLRNVNTHEDYLAALEIAGLSTP